MQSGKAPLRIGIAGLGAIGKSVAEKLDAGIPGLRLTAIAARDIEAARGRVKLKAPWPACGGLCRVFLIIIWCERRENLSQYPCAFQEF